MAARRTVALRLHRHRRRPQRTDLCRNAGARRPLGAGARGAAAGRRRGFDARVRRRFPRVGVRALVHLMPRRSGARAANWPRTGSKWAARSMPTTACRPTGAPFAVGEGFSGSRTRRAYRNYAAADAPLRACARTAPVQGSASARHQRVEGLRRARASRLADPQARTARHARAAAHRRHERVRPFGGTFRIGLLKGALGFDAVLGTNFGPRSPGTVLTLLYRLAAESRGGAGGLSQPLGRCRRTVRRARPSGAARQVQRSVRRRR